MKKTFEEIVDFLVSVANEDESSIQINNDGKVILRIGVSQVECITIDDMVSRLVDHQRRLLTEKK